MKHEAEAKDAGTAERLPDPCPTLYYADLSYRARRDLVSAWLKDNPKFVICSLSYREREIIKLRYGLGEGYFYTLEDVGHIFKVTRERIRGIERKALAKIDRARASA